MEGLEVSNRMFFGESRIHVEPSRPAPGSTLEPSEKVKDALAEILPRIEALKSPRLNTESPEEE